MNRSRGFTLIEVLAALVIVAIGMSAVLSTLGSSAGTVGYLRDKTLAQWIALNQITQTRLSGALPQTGTTDGKLDYAGRRWRWRQQVTDGGIPGVFQIEVSVQQADTPAGNNAPWIGTAVGVMGSAVAPPQMISLYNEYAQFPGSSPGAGPAGSPPGTVPPPQPGATTPFGAPVPQQSGSPLNLGGP